MTEAEWLAWTDTRPMLHFLLGGDYPRVQAVETFPDCRASDRKLRLFACACYHRIRHLLPDRRAQAAVEVAEQVAEGVMSEDERRRAEATVREPLEALEGRWRASRGAERMALLPTHEALALAGVILWDQPQKAAYYAASNAHLAFACIANPGEASSDSGFSHSRAAEERVQTDLLRCIFGPLPFRPASLAPSWLAWNNGTVPKVAQAIYDDRAFDRLPILADALEEAGCANADILAHCRSPGERVLGCWAVDLVLGKE
jgi:hypothetical protein